MTDLHIAPTYNLTKTRYVTPLVVGSLAKRRMVIKCCDAVNENAAEFEDAVCGWIECFFAIGHDDLTVTVKVYYSNTTMSKALLTIVALLERWYTAGKRVTLNWWYDVEDYDDSIARELHDDIRCSELTLPIHFLAYNR
jgi:hypothetical protein